LIRLDLSPLGAPVPEAVRAFNDRLAALLAPLPKAHQIPPEVTRKARAEGRSVFPVGGPLEGSVWREIPGAPGGPGRVRVSPAPGAARGVYLHIHGGGWTFGSPELFDAPNQRVAAETGLTVVSAAYRLAPEHPWPACADDVDAAALWLATGGAAALGGGPLLIGGESAGAHLAAVALLRMKARGLIDRFAAVSFTYGAFDLRMTPSAATAPADALILPFETLAWFYDNLTAGDRALRADPALSPLLADLAGFPPAQILAGGADPLRDDSLLMAARLTAAGVEAETLVFPGAVHGFDQLADHPQAEAAAAARIAFLARRAAAAA
jgi:acetyl esterase/lipase